MDVERVEDAFTLGWRLHALLRILRRFCCSGPRCAVSADPEPSTAACSRCRPSAAQLGCFGHSGARPICLAGRAQTLLGAAPMAKSVGAIVSRIEPRSAEIQAVGAQIMSSRGMRDCLWFSTQGFGVELARRE